MDCATLQYRATQDIAETQNLCVATIFGDVKMAFASMCRNLVAPMPESEELLVRRMLEAGVSEDIVQQIMTELVDYSSWLAAGGTEHLQALVCDLQSSTWASFEGLNDVLCTEGGTLAGHPLGGALFCMGYSKLLNKSHVVLKAEDLIH